MTSPVVTVVDLGSGNLGSIVNMAKRVGADAVVTDDPGVVRRAAKVLLPGVGAFDAAMTALRDRGIEEALEGRRAAGIPILGICLGLQLLAGGSEEGVEPGLGWIDGRVVRFSPGDARTPLRVPHMGWNSVEAVDDDPLFGGRAADARYYFAHSYHIVCDRPADVVGTTLYGARFASVVRRDNVCGTQFHPEKSHRHGLRVLSNFVQA